MKISEAASRTGLSKDTIRYYEKIGLLHPQVIQYHRDYQEGDVEQLEIILKLKETGFSLQEIKRLIDWSKDADESRELSPDEIHNLKQIKTFFQNKYDQMKKKEKEIKEIKQVLLQADGKINDLLEKNE
ncbi:MerR family transcriptional regulator [Lysinibacillus sphaericus]